MLVLFYTLVTLFVVVSLFMMLLILIQKGRGGGLASAFGGGGGNTAFGSKTGDVLTWATSITFGIFLMLAVFLNLAANKIGTPVRPPESTPVSAPAATQSSSAAAGVPTTMP